MISIKQFLEQRRRPALAEGAVLEASLQMGRLLLDAMATHVVRGREADYRAFDRSVKELVRILDRSPSAFNLLEVASRAAEAVETHALRATEYFSEQKEQMQSMVAMLTETLADISGQTNASIARLQDIEQQIERASGLDDMKALSASLERCLAAVREAAAQQKLGSARTAKRLQDQINAVQTRMSPIDLPPKRAEIEVAPEPETPCEP